jgi:hypothetical protein
MKVKLNGRLIPAHRFVLAARSEYWGVPSLVDVDFLGNMCCACIDCTVKCVLTLYS